MGLTERHWLEDEQPELTESQIEDIISENDRAYQRGYAARDAEIVRCKDCIHGVYVSSVGMLPFVTCCGVDHELDWFCADGERAVKRE